MRFIHPEALWGLLSLAVPIIVHLFNFRKFRKVAFSNVAFLKEIRQETHKTRNLKHLLILLVRLLALTCLAFAFARPYFPANESGTPGSSVVSVYIDNSRSMEARGSDGILLEIAKNQAITLAEAFAASDRFQLLTTDFEGKHQRLVSRDEFIQIAQEVQVGPSSHPLAEAARRQLELLNRSESKNLFLFQLTDLQKTTSDPADMPIDSNIMCTILPQTADLISNIYIDSVWFESPVHTLSRPDDIHVRLVNTGGEDRPEVPIRWMVNDVQRSVGTITIPANAKAETILTCSFTEPGEKICRIEIDDSGIISDDKYFFNYQVTEIIPVLEVKGKECTSNAVAAIFAEDDYFSYREMSENQIDFADLSGFRLIVLHQMQQISNGLQKVLNDFISAGGSVLLIPSHSIDLETHNQFLTLVNAGSIQPFSESHNIIKQLNTDHPLLRDAFDKSDERTDLPEIEGYYPYMPGPNTQPIASLASGEPFISITRQGNGSFYFLSTTDDIQYSGFVRHALFPAILIRMAESSAPSAPLAYELGNGFEIMIKNFNRGNESIQLKNAANGSEYMPEIRSSGLDAVLHITSEMKMPGNYQVISGDSIVNIISLNLPRDESDNRAWKSDDFNAALDSSGKSSWGIMQGDSDSIAASLQNIQANGSSMWYMLIIWSLIFLAIEVLLLKFWRS
jgi:hypothetical protein